MKLPIGGHLNSLLKTGGLMREPKMCMWIFVIALFTIIRRWKQPTQPTTNKQINMVYSHKWNIIQS